MLYVYRRRNSTGARDLAEGIMLGAEGLRGIPARRIKGETAGAKLRALTPQDQVICWGDFFAAPAGIRVLNNVEPISKYAEAKLLKEKGVNTVEVSRTKPNVRVAARAAFVPQPFNVRAGALDEAQITELINQMTAHRHQVAAARAAYNAQPAQPAETWLPRRNNHVGGNDLLEANLAQPDFYSKKLDIKEEYRIHMFRGKSIRAGKKVQAPDRVAHPHAWIRSFDAGWTIKYDGFESTKDMRKLAKAALKALGLDFGAVDMGKTADGKLVVLEVNRAPGVEGGTVEAYAKHIINWVKNPGQPEAEE